MSLTRSMTYSRKIIFHVILPSLLTVSLFVFVIFGIILPTLEDSILDKKREMIRELTQTAWNILALSEQKERSGTLTRQQAQAEAMALIKQLRYGVDSKDYFWINDTHPTMIVHPYRQDLEGSDISTWADPNGKYFFVEFVKVVNQHGEGYVDYMWQWKDDSTNVVPKISFVKGFQPWGWIVGTGIYIEDVRKEIEEVTYQLYLIAFGGLTLISLLSGYIVFRGIRDEQSRQEAETALQQAHDQLEVKVQERTSELADSLNTQSKISENLLSTTQDLKESRQQMEQQLTELQASHSKLEALDSLNDQLLQKMNTLHETRFPALKNYLNKLLEVAPADTKDLTRQAVREFYFIEDNLRPFQSLYLSEQAIQSRRVLLVETVRKQQVIAKMALGGTGVKLDIVTTVEEASQQLEEKQYDILCVNAETIELTNPTLKKYPDLKIVFMTSEDVPTYLPTLQQYPFLSNIVSRNDEDRIFTLKNMSTTVNKLLTNDFFGLEKYLNWGVEVQRHFITNSETRGYLISDMEYYFSQLGIRRSMIQKSAMVAEELLMNAIYDAPTDAKGKALYNHLPRTVPVELEPEEQGVFRYACDGLLLAISVEDPFGAFDRETILNYLESCYEGRHGSLQENKGGAGRGLFQIMETADLVVFNVRPKVRTEVIVIFNIDPNKSKTSQITSFHYFYG